MKINSLLIITYTLLVFPVMGYTAEFIVGLPGFYAGNQKADLYEPIHSFITKTMANGDTLWLYDAYSLERIAKISIPKENDSYKNPKYRRIKLRKELRLIKDYIDQIPKSGENSINLPRFLDHLATSIFTHNAVTKKQPSILIIGDAKHRNPKEPTFNMRNGYFPSDGHLNARPEDSVYGTKGNQNRLVGFRVHFLHTNTPESWYNDLYHNRIKRFWHLFIHKQGGLLATFTHDKPVAYERFQNGEATLASNETIDRTANKIEMLRADRNGSVFHEGLYALSDDVQFLKMDTPISTLPATHAIGILKVGIRWKCIGCDIDIYARGSNDMPYLFFSNVESKEGRYFKDFRSSPDAVNGLEYIEFTQPVDLHEIQVYVNHYSGEVTNGPVGAVRVFFNGRTYEAPFHLRSTTGNKGKDISRAASSHHWQVIDIPAIVGLPKKTQSRTSAANTTQMTLNKASENE